MELDYRRKLVDEIKRVLRRSFYILRLDSGSCNGCDIEIFAALTPVYDAERFGIRLVSSPRQADALVVTGPVTRQFKDVLLRVYEMLPEPRIVIAVGACACSGGIWHDSYAVEGGIDRIIPVDVYVPGCPPHPAAIIHGLLVALGIMGQKLKKTSLSKEAHDISIRQLIRIVGWECYKRIRILVEQYLGYKDGWRLITDLSKLLVSVKSLDEALNAIEALKDSYSDDRVAAALDKVAKVLEAFNPWGDRG